MSWAHSAMCDQNGGRRGCKLAHVLWECMLKFSNVRSCGGVCPLFLMHVGAYAHCFTYDLWECVFIELMPDSQLSGVLRCDWWREGHVTRRLEFFPPFKAENVEVRVYLGL